MSCSSNKKSYHYEYMAYDALIYSQATYSFPAHNYYLCDECEDYHLTSEGQPHQDLSLPETKEKIRTEKMTKKYGY